MAQQGNIADGENDSALGSESSSGSFDNAVDDSSHAGKVAAVWTHQCEIFTAILTAGSAVIHGAGGTTTLAYDAVATFRGQALSLPSDGSGIKVDGSILSFDRIAAGTKNDQTDREATAVLTVSHQTLTAMMHGSSLILQVAGLANI
jgi:hypothetical protein